MVIHGGFNLNHLEKQKKVSGLLKNAYRFGFIVRYPQDRTAETGYQYEPWHLRYVGGTSCYRDLSGSINFRRLCFKCDESNELFMGLN